MISVRSSSTKKYIGLEEKKQHHNLQKSEYSLSKGQQQSTQISSPQHTRQQILLKELDLDKRIQKFQSSLLSVKGADVISQNQQYLSPQPKQNGSSNISQFSSHLTNSLTTTIGQSGRNRYTNQSDQFNQKRLRKIVKNYSGKIIESNTSTDKKETENVFQSVYNHDYTKNFIRNSSLIGLNTKTHQDSPLSQLKSFIGSYDNNTINHTNNINDSLSSPNIRNNLNLLRNSVNTNTYDQVVNDLIQNKLPQKRSYSNNLFKKNFLKPLKRDEQSSQIDPKLKTNNSFLYQKEMPKIKYRSISQEVIEKKPNAFENERKQQQNLQIQAGDILPELQEVKEVSEFDNLLQELKQDEKTTQINDEDVISEYQVILSNKQNTLNNKQNQPYSTTSILKTQENMTETTISHEQEMIQYLMQTQPQYFDHKAGRCLCSICSCGVCINKCKQISQHLDTNLKSNWISTYKQQFRNKYSGQDLGQGDSLNQITMSYKSELDSCPELYCSTTKNDYKYRQTMEGPLKIKSRVYTENRAPISSLSTYNSQYVNWGIPPQEIIRQSQQKTVLDKLPFNHMTTYEENFHKRFDPTPSKKCIPKNMNPLPNIGVFLGESTTHRQFNEKTNTFFQLPKKRQHTPPDQIPSYNGQFTSETQKAYDGIVQKCQAREILRKKFLEKYSSKPLLINNKNEGIQQVN